MKERKLLYILALWISSKEVGAPLRTYFVQRAVNIVKGYTYTSQDRE
jgi:hypothetical protein